MTLEASEAKLTWIRGQIWSKRQWLETHSKRFPEHEVEAKRMDMEMLEQLGRDYERVVERYRERVA